MVRGSPSFGPILQVAPTDLNLESLLRGESKTLHKQNNQNPDDFLVGG